jgi:hypothetical protein
MKLHYLAIILFLLACNSASDKQTQKIPVAQQLAIKDGITDTADIRAARIRGFVGILSDTYNEPEDTIGEYTYRAKQVLDDRGIPSTNLGILEDIFQMDKLDNTSYQDAVTMYLLLRTNNK